MARGNLNLALSKKTISLLQVIQEVSDKKEVFWELVAAIVDVESTGNPFAMRYEPAYKYTLTPDKFAKELGTSVETETQLQKFSYGLGQVMGGVAREHGFNLELVRLCDPRMGLEYCVRHLKKFLDKYSANEQDAISAYNQGSNRKNEDGMYANFGYVTKVVTRVNLLRKIN